MWISDLLTSSNFYLSLKIFAACVIVGTVLSSEPCYNGGQCVPPVQCAPYYLSSLLKPDSFCLVGQDSPGICCNNYKSSCK